MPGSDKDINYGVRPAKSIQRKMICNLIGEIQVNGGLRNFRYIGLGAKYFSDFVLMHNQFGVTNMISIEAQKDKELRYEFNKPLGFIKMEYGYTYERLPQINEWDKQDNLVWLDYDDAFSDKIIDDMNTILVNCHSGDMLIVTVNSSYGGTKQSEKKEKCKEALGKYFDEGWKDDYFTNKNITLLESKIMAQVVEDGLKRKKRLHGIDLAGVQLLSLSYHDSAPMLTVGFLFADEGMNRKINYELFKDKFSFVSNADEMFKLAVPSLTNREMKFILKELPISDADYSEDRFFGISLEEIRLFENIYRYFPYYTESAFNN